MANATVKLPGRAPAPPLSAGQWLRRATFLGLIAFALVVSVTCVMHMTTWIGKPFAGFLINQRMLVVSLGQYNWTGIAAGLKYPDKILTANGTPVTSLRDLEAVIQARPIGDLVRYVVNRDGKTFEATVPTMRFTWVDLMVVYGIPFMSALVYLFMAIGVFIPKPDAKLSWAFFVACFFLSIYNITGADDTSLPIVRLNLFTDVFVSGSFIYLSFLFPETQEWVVKRPYLQYAPFVQSALVAVPMALLYPHPAFAPFYQFAFFYRIVAAITVVSAITMAYLKNASLVARQRARVVLLGAALAFPIPAFAILFSWLGITVAGIQIQNNFMTIPLLLFPTSIAYAIGKHDLFAIDIIIRRTYGYILSTATVVGAYAFVVFTLNLIFQSSDISRSPVFSLAFALGVVFIFEPLHRHIQGFVDRMFYRQRYDYRKTIREISETMIRILDPEQIYQTLIGSVVREMFLENGIILIPDLHDQHYHPHALVGIQGAAAQTLPTYHVCHDSVLTDALREKGDALFRYDVDLHPNYESQREVLRDAFETLASELMLPLKYKDEMRGIISLGRKKSGKMFTLEDLDLLTTMANQSAVALENAKLFEENLEKTRMEEELNIARDLQVSMLPEQAPKIAGVSIAANSIQAREVGGDFYDFIEIDGNGAGEQVAIVVGDVSGKAVSGALVMAASRSVFRALTESHASVEEVMTVGNVRLNRDIKKGMFVALLYAVLDPQHKTLTLSNAGQTQPIRCSADQSEPVFIDTEGDRFPLGIVKNCHYQATRVSLQSGDTLVFYTDGIVEAMNRQGELYGFERFMAAVQAGKTLDANGLLEKLLNDVSGYVGDAEQHDDLTIVVAKIA